MQSAHAVTVLYFPQSNGHLRGYKYELWEGGVRTVAFMYSPSPSVLPHRGVTDCLVHVSDWYLTLVEVSGGWGAWVESGGVIPSALDSRYRCNPLQ